MNSVSKKKTTLASQRSMANTSIFTIRTQLIGMCIALAGFGIALWGLAQAPQRLDITLLGFILVLPGVIFGMRGTGGG